MATYSSSNLDSDQASHPKTQNNHGWAAEKKFQSSSHVHSSVPRGQKRKLNHEQKPTTNGIMHRSSKPTSHFQDSRPSPHIHHSATAKTALPTEKRLHSIQSRDTLPVRAHASSICRSLSPSSTGNDNDVLILVGETGSGKSTQVPQILSNEKWCTGVIAVTQPRRVAAVSLARRVAEEMGTTLGKTSRTSKVGYSVRFDTNVAKEACKIKFLTEGMLLQEILRDPWLNEYSIVIVDEVHERSLDCDLILGYLRRLVCIDQLGNNGGRKKELGKLKVMVMSATADVEKLVQFFEEGFQQSIRDERLSKPMTNGINGSIMSHNEANSQTTLSDEESESSWQGLESSIDPDKPVTVNGIHGHQRASSGDPSVHTNGIIKATSDFSNRISTCYIEGRQYPVQTMYVSDAVSDWVDAALRTIIQIHRGQALPGDILVFCTGQATIESLENEINEIAEALTPNVLALPLFAALSQSSQQAIFQPAPPNTRKIILATNIAETSVTIPGVRYVVDCGLAKVKEFRTQLSLESLLVKPISQTSAIQRKGRAGREAPGICYRIYTEPEYLKLQATTIPEILRCDLASAILNMKARGVEDVFNFPFLDPPKKESLRKALFQLIRLQALNPDSSITDAGRRMARLPLTPALSRVLIEAAEDDKNCVLPVIDAISALTVENIFLPIPLEKISGEGESARRRLQRREGDHITLAQTVQEFDKEQSDRKKFCRTYSVNRRAMRNVMDVRKQLREQCVRQKLLSPEASFHGPISGEMADTMLKCFVKGFVGNTARLMPDGAYRTNEGNHTISIHPSSVLYGHKVEAIVYNEFLFTSKPYARCASAIQMDWYADAVGR